MTPKQRYAEIEVRINAASNPPWHGNDATLALGINAHTDLTYLLRRVRRAEELMRRSQVWWDEKFMEAFSGLRIEWDAFLADEGD